MAKKKQQAQKKARRRRRASLQTQRTPALAQWPASELERLEHKVLHAYDAAVKIVDHEDYYFKELGGPRRYAIAWSMEQMAAAVGGHPAAWAGSSCRHWVGAGNPLHAWAAYLECRVQGMPIPEWVLTYLDRVAHLFHRQTRAGVPPPKKPAAAIAEILEMKRPGRQGRSGRGSVFSTYSHVKDLMLAAAVRHKTPSDGKLYLAIEEVATENGTSPSTVERAWNKYKALLDE